MSQVLAPTVITSALSDTFTMIHTHMQSASAAAAADVRMRHNR